MNCRDCRWVDLTIRESDRGWVIGHCTAPLPGCMTGDQRLRRMIDEENCPLFEVSGKWVVEEDL